MDINALISTIFSNESVAGIAAQAGVTEADAKNVLSSAVPMLLDGANAQSIDEATAESFAGALAQHAQSDTTDISAFLKGVDLQDGAKIIGHLLGGTAQKQTEDVGQRAGVSPANTGNILASAAPLLMSLLGKQAASDENSGAGVASLMGSLLGGGSATSLIGSLLGADGDAKDDKDDKKDDKKSGLGVLGKLLGGLIK